MKTDKERIEQMIREGMYEGNMHRCLRDIGSLAGGYLAAKRISEADLNELRNMAIGMSINKRTAEKGWDEAVSFGMAKPVADSFVPSRCEENRAIGWDEVVKPEDFRIVDQKWLEKEAVVEPDKWQPCKELAEYINMLFLPTDIVAYCTDPFDRDGKWIPSKGNYTKKAKEIIKSLKKNSKTGMEEAVGTLNDESGAWIRINPFDGTDVKDSNVTEFRHALIECDTLPIDEQVAIYRKMELPCVCIVHSGSKSAHAIVRINASSIEEYRKRVNFLYDVCKNNGLEIDTQNRNPSRYSRMPGVMRKDKKQYIIAKNVGKKSWDEWETWIKDLNDDLPDFEPLTQNDISNPPDLAPELIEGILRVKHKMIISGPSKAGKSFLLIELAVCIAEGLEWLGHKCRKGRVLYVNLELDKNSCTRRFSEIYKAMGVPPDNISNIDRWNLRGRTMPLDKLAPKLIRRAKGKTYDVIIIDPIYKVLTGDENSASDMAEFCNLFDRIGHDCDAAIIFCHHHSKGGQGEKKASDRASGSGVFARDPDAIMDMLQVNTASVLSVISNRRECEAMLKKADSLAYDDEWKKKIDPDDKVVANRLVEVLIRVLGEDSDNDIREARSQAVEQVSTMTGWMLSLTLREFPTPKPFGMFFLYPLHILDGENYLIDCPAEGEQKRTSSKKRAPKQKQDKQSAFKQCFEMNPNERWTILKVSSQFEVSRQTVYNWCEELGYSIFNGLIRNNKTQAVKIPARNEVELSDDPIF